jgi:hypothetical protein
LARTLTERQIVAQLNRLGELSATGRPHTMHTIKWIRWKYRIPAPSLKRPEELTVQELATRLRVLPDVVYYWAKRGVIKSRRINDGSHGLDHHRRNQVAGATRPRKAFT